MTISIIVIPSVIHQGNDTRVPNVTFIPFCAQRQAQSEPPPDPLPLQKDWLHTNCFLLLLVSGRAMCYLTKNNNEEDGKCNLIPLIQLPLSPSVTGKQEAITVQRWHRFRTRGKRGVSASRLSGTHRDSSLPHLPSPPLINGIVSLWQLFVIIGRRQWCEWALWFNYRRSRSRLISWPLCAASRCRHASAHLDRKNNSSLRGGIQGLRLFQIVSIQNSVTATLLCFDACTKGNTPVRSQHFVVQNVVSTACAVQQSYSTPRQSALTVRERFQSKGFPRQQELERQ